MASVRNAILSVFETRMKEIDGTGNFVYNLGNRVERIGEELDSEVQKFTDFPKMYYFVENIDAEYMLGGYIREFMAVHSYTAFNEKLTGSQIDDFTSDVYIALGGNIQDYKMEGNAEFFIVQQTDSRWVAENNLTVIHHVFSCQSRRHMTER